MDKLQDIIIGLDADVLQQEKLIHNDLLFISSSNANLARGYCGTGEKEYAVDWYFDMF